MYHRTGILTFNLLNKKCNMARPYLSRVPEFYHGYINYVQQDDIMEAFREHTAMLEQFLDKIPTEKQTFRYAAGKWSIKEVLQHIIDAEKIFAYRALCFARKESQSLPGFDENSYAANSKADKRNWNDLREEFRLLRRSTMLMFKSFDEEQLESAGVSNGKSIYVRAIGYIIIGHAAHHAHIIRERYL